MQGIKAALALADLDAAAVGEPLPDGRLCAAADVILSYQNRNGGWPTYELMRSGAALEWINPAETFGGIMVDYSYVECSSACMTALTAFRRRCALLLSLLGLCACWACSSACMAARAAFRRRLHAASCNRHRCAHWSAVRLCAHRAQQGLHGIMRTPYIYAF